MIAPFLPKAIDAKTRITMSLILGKELLPLLAHDIDQTVVSEVESVSRHAASSLYLVALVTRDNGK